MSHFLRRLKRGLKKQESKCINWLKSSHLISPLDKKQITAVTNAEPPMKLPKDPNKLYPNFKNLQTPFQIHLKELNSPLSCYF